MEDMNIIFEDNKVKYHFGVGTYCQEKDTNCSFNLDKDLYLGIGDTFIWQPREHFKGIKFEVVEISSFILFVKEIGEV
ncbi:MAG: hypothetical protein PHX70_14380 [Clostridium sp.]|nr:hypothetical protein [Clostridium sp.]